MDNAVHVRKPCQGRKDHLKEGCHDVDRQDSQQSVSLYQGERKWEAKEKD